MSFKDRIICLFLFCFIVIGPFGIVASIAATAIGSIGSYDGSAVAAEPIHVEDPIPQTYGRYQISTLIDDNGITRKICIIRLDTLTGQMCIRHLSMGYVSGNWKNLN